MVERHRESSSTGEVSMGSDVYCCTCTCRPTATVHSYTGTCAGVVFTAWALLCGTGTDGVVSSCTGDRWWSVQ